MHSFNGFLFLTLVHFWLQLFMYILRNSCKIGETFFNNGKLITCIKFFFFDTYPKNRKYILIENYKTLKTRDVVIEKTRNEKNVRQFQTVLQTLRKSSFFKKLYFPFRANNVSSSLLFLHWYADETPKLDFFARTCDTW